MRQGIVPEYHAHLQRMAAVEKAIEARYKDRLAAATPDEERRLRKEMSREIARAARRDAKALRWWQIWWSPPWLR